MRDGTVEYHPVKGICARCKQEYHNDIPLTGKKSIYDGFSFA
jgi:hypothetical protein